MFKEVNRTPFDDLQINIDFDSGTIELSGMVSFSDGKKLFHVPVKMTKRLDEIKDRASLMEEWENFVNKISQERLAVLNRILL